MSDIAGTKSKNIIQLLLMHDIRGNFNLVRFTHLVMTCSITLCQLIIKQKDQDKIINAIIEVNALPHNSFILKEYLDQIVIVLFLNI